MGFQLDYSDMQRVVIEAVIIVCFAMAVGLALNHQMVMDAFTGKVVTKALPDQETIESVPVPVSLEDVKFLDNRSVLVDARISELYAEGHLAGAVSLPLADFDKNLPDFLLTYPLKRPLIVYCSGYGCNDSFDLAVRLLDAGYNDVMVYEGGYPEWRDAGLPVETGAP